MKLSLILCSKEIFPLTTATLIGLALVTNFTLKFYLKTAEIYYMTDREKEFIKLHKRFLNLSYKMAQLKISGDTPPDDLLWEIADIERKIRLISKALE